MQAIYSNLRARFFIRFVILLISVASATSSWGNFYTAQKQDSITDASIDSFTTANEVAQKYSVAIHEFYASNKHQYVWMQPKGVKQIAKEFITHVNKLAPNTIDSNFILQLTKQNFSQNNAPTTCI